MGITKNCCSFLFYSKSLGVSYERTLMLGRLTLNASKDNIRASIKKYHNNPKNLEDVVFKDKYSEPLFELLGAVQVDSMDFSDYEKATIVHDLNLPVPGHLKGKFSAIVDGGTIEHVFNFPTAIKNCMEMLETGGHFIAITPANNLMGHGFYQFSPELYFNIFSEENGFAVKKMIIATLDTNGEYSPWYEVTEPRKLKSRVMLTNSRQTFLMVLAEKKEVREIFKVLPQQSDYQMIWGISESLREGRPPGGEGRLKYLYRKFTPRPVKRLIHALYSSFAKREIENEDLGKVNAAHFKKIET